MKNPFESSNSNKYSPLSYLEKQRYFNLEQQRYLDAEVVEMEEDALSEDEYEGKINSRTGKPITKEFIEQAKNKALQARDRHKLSDKILDLRSQVDENPKITREYRKVSKYLEALFYKNLGGKNGWIPNAIVWKTSRYDDYIHGIDFIVETDDKEFSLATDMTFSDSKNLTKKLNNTKHHIQEGQLPTLTFYDQAEQKDKPIPHVIIAIEHEKAIKALTLWSDGQKEELANHPLKAKTMLEVEAQLESFAVYAKSIGRRDIASAYNDMLAKIQLLIINHEETIKKYQELIDDDKAYVAIMKFCNDLKKEAEQIEKSKKQ